MKNADKEVKDLKESLATKIKEIEDLNKKINSRRISPITIVSIIVVILAAVFYYRITLHRSHLDYKNQLQAKETEMDEIIASLMKREEKINKLLIELELKEQTINEHKRDIKSKVKEINALKGDLETKEQTVEELTEELKVRDTVTTSRDDEIQEIIPNFMEKVATIERLQNEILIQNQTINELTSRLNASPDINAIKQDLLTKNKRIDELVNESQNKDKTINELKSDLETKIPGINVLKQELVIKSKKIEELINESKLKDNTINDLKTNSEKKISEIDVLRRNLNMKDKEIEKLIVALSNKDEGNGSIPDIPELQVLQRTIGDIITEAREADPEIIWFGIHLTAEAIVAHAQKVLEEDLPTCFEETDDTYDVEKSCYREISYRLAKKIAWDQRLGGQWIVTVGTVNHYFMFTRMVISDRHEYFIRIGDILLELIRYRWEVINEDRVYGRDEDPEWANIPKFTNETVEEIEITPEEVKKD